MKPEITLYRDHNWHDRDGNTDYYTNIRVPEQLEESFKKLINQALNANPDCHPALKDFGDMLIDGEIKQDYWSQRTDIKSTYTIELEYEGKYLSYNHMIEMSTCGHCFGKGHHHRHDCPALKRNSPPQSEE